MLEMGTMSLDQIAALLADAPDGVGVVEAPVSRSSAKADAAKHHELCPGSKFWQKLDLLTERRVGCALTRLAVGTTFNIARTRVSGTLS